MADRNEDEVATGSMPTERELLVSHLQGARDALVWKVEGLDDQDRRRPMTPTGTNLVGLVKHMTWIEGWYLCEFFGRERPRLEWEWEIDAEWGHLLCEARVASRSNLLPVLDHEYLDTHPGSLRQRSRLKAEGSHLAPERRVERVGVRPERVKGEGTAFKPALTRSDVVVSTTRVE